MKQKLLKCLVSSDLTVTANHHDGTPFTLKADINNLQLNEPFTEEKKRVEGWLFVEQIGVQNKRAYIALPGPTLQFGRHVHVSVFDLQDANLTIADFIQR